MPSHEPKYRKGDILRFSRNGETHELPVRWVQDPGILEDDQWVYVFVLDATTGEQIDALEDEVEHVG